ncbi:MAG: DUF805 domain-containing protein [Gemmatimonadaceae bacterium]
MRQLLRLWFSPDEPVDRRTYFEHGLGLAVVKYAVDAALIWTFVHVPWTPVDYITAGVSLEQSKLAGVPMLLSTALALWTAPFFWIGLSMSARRARDAGTSAWFAQLFFVPVLNYVFIAIMCALPSRSTEPSAPAIHHGRPPERELARQLRAIGLGAAAGIGMILLAVGPWESYGAGLFFGGPFLIGAVTAYAYNRSYPATPRETRAVVLLTLVIIGLATIAFAIEGLLCLVMALPFAFLIALMGSSFGRWMALTDHASPRQAALAMLLLPAAAPLMDSRDAPKLYEVRSAIDIDAPPLTVWQNVVSFPRLDRPTDLLFRIGVAYPIGARIDGQGVGAMRYCDFSTGAFEEPITRWEPGARLSFDILRNPPPMREWSPYAIAPPHLDGYFTAKRGEFRLIALPNGRTRLEGSTWYELRMGPEVYWAWFATAIVERIHTRVLVHIKQVSESSKGGAP